MFVGEDVAASTKNFGRGDLIIIHATIIYDKTEARYDGAEGWWEVPTL